jgi:hypothetical protein
MEETIHHQLANKITSSYTALDYSMVVAEVSTLSQEEAQLSLDWLSSPAPRSTSIPSFIQRIFFSNNLLSLLRSNLGYGSF